MKIKKSFGDKVFDICNISILTLISLLTLYPFWDSFVVSISPLHVYLSNPILLWPQEISLEAYRFILGLDELWSSYANSIFRTVVGTIINMLVTTMAAYVLSKSDLPGQRIIMFLIIFTMMFSGGLIPTFLIVRGLGIMNTQWALIWPVTIITFHLIILRNFFSGLPAEIEESAMIDGCTEIGILFKIVLPVSKPAVVTIALFYAVFHWNDFFLAVLYITSRDQWPLQLFLRSLLFEDEAILLGGGEALFLLGQPMKMATVMVAIIPIMCVFPFFQKYFIQGTMVGAVKG